MSKYLMRIIFPFISENNKVFLNYTYPSFSKGAVHRWMAEGMQQRIELDPPEHVI